MTHLLPNTFPQLQQELEYIKDNLFSKYATDRYNSEIQLLESLRPFVSFKTEKILNTLCEYHRYKGILEVLHEEKSTDFTTLLEEELN